MRLLSFCLMALLTIGATCGGALFYLLYHPWVDLTTIQCSQDFFPSLILDDEGVEWTRFQLEQHTAVPLSVIPESVIHAFLATEDRTFYQHFGISWYGIARSIVRNISHRRFAQGASTITQQLVRILFFDTTKTVWRKIKEQFLSLSVEQRYSKDQILEAYLNNIYFGCGMYGVTAAAQRFWGKQVQELTLDEAALLAGIVRSPRTYCPLLQPLNSLQRRNVVLSCMYQAGYITETERDAARLRPVTITAQEVGSCIAPHARNMIRTMVEEQFGKHALYTEGLTIKTTLNSTIQKIATQTFCQQIETMRHTLVSTIDGAVLILESTTGAVKALVGGYDYRMSQFNRVTQSYRQLGSIFKPLIYATALEQGFLLSDTAVDEPVQIQDHSRLWQPNNVTKKFEGKMTLAYALARSNNIVSLKTLTTVTPTAVIAAAQKAGISVPIHPHLSLALGCIDTSVWEATTLFNTLINQGMYVKPHLVSWVKNAQGTKIWSHTPEKRRVCSWGTSSMIVHILCQSMDRLKQYAYMPHFPAIAACGKTGTTNDARNCWFVGATPTYTTAVYIGSDDNRSLPHTYATRTALPLWLMINARISQPSTTFSYDPHLHEIAIDTKTGLAPEGDAERLRILIPASYDMTLRSVLTLDAALEKYYPHRAEEPSDTDAALDEQIPEHSSPDESLLPLPEE